MSSDVSSGAQDGGGHDASGMMRWLLTYADMITLLMAFFIMMYSMSVLNQEKFSRAAAGLREEFGPQPTAASEAGGSGALPLPGSVAPSPRFEEGVESVGEQLESYIDENKLEDVVRVRHDPKGLTVSLVSDNVLFRVGEAELRPAALSLLRKIARLLKSVPNAIVVEGHTCNLPISTPRYPSNWELSAARACSVVRYLAEHEEISAQRLSAIGYGDSRPVSPNRTEESRVLNRRVDIVILSRPLSFSGTSQETLE